jgi:hypothetical protein
MKKGPNKEEKVTVMIGGGDESIFIKVNKGEKVYSNGHKFIAGETLEENKKRWEDKMKETNKEWEKFNKRLDKEEKKSERLDFKTWLYLYITHARRVKHPKVVDVDTKRTMYIKDSKKNEIFIFKNYEEYKKYFLMYLDNIEDDVIDLAIYTRSSKGQIIALKGLCEHIIVKKKINEFYNSITEEQIKEIHAKGKLTPLEAVQMWESFDLCIEGSKSIFSKSRCQYFNENCHECLLEQASHKLEHDPIEFETTNSMSSSKTYMDSFMQKLENNEFEKDTCPQTGKEFTGEDEEIESEIKKYQSLLASGIIDQIVTEEQENEKEKQLIRKKD